MDCVLNTMVVKIIFESWNYLSMRMEIVKEVNIKEKRWLVTFTITFAIGILWYKGCWAWLLCSVIFELWKLCDRIELALFLCFLSQSFALDCIMLSNVYEFGFVFENACLGH